MICTTVPANKCLLRWWRHVPGFHMAPATGFVSTALLPTGFVSTRLHNNFSTYSTHSRCKTYKYEARSYRTCSTEQICRRSSCKRLGLLVLGCTQCLPSTPLHQTKPLAEEWNYEIIKISPECLSAEISSTLWATLGGLFKISVIRVRASKASATKRQFPHRFIIGRPGLAPRGVLKRNYHSEIMKNYHPEIMRSLLMWIPFHLVPWALMTSTRHQEIEIWEDSKTAQWRTRADKCCCQRSFTELKNWTDALSRFTWEGALMEVTIPLSPKLRVPHFNTHNYRSTTCA